jgi:hypothetical protein
VLQCITFQREHVKACSPCNRIMKIGGGKVVPQNLGIAAFSLKRM